jgi:hypothetical protein
MKIVSILTVIEKTVHLVAAWNGEDVEWVISMAIGQEPKISPVVGSQKPSVKVTVSTALGVGCGLILYCRSGESASEASAAGKASVLRLNRVVQNLIIAAILMLASLQLPATLLLHLRLRISYDGSIVFPPSERALPFDVRSMFALLPDRRM